MHVNVNNSIADIKIVSTHIIFIKIIFINKRNYTTVNNILFK